MEKHSSKHSGHAASGGTPTAPMEHGSGGGHYGRFAWMLVLSFVAMYVLMYAMVDRLGNAVPNINQFYMAGLMAAPMLVIELLLMAKMYPNRRWNLLLAIGALIFMAACWFGIRE